MRAISQTLTLGSPPSFLMRQPSWRQSPQHAWPRHALGHITYSPSCGAFPRHQRSIWCYLTFSISARFVQDSFLKPSHILSPGARKLHGGKCLSRFTFFWYLISRQHFCRIATAARFVADLPLPPELVSCVISKLHRKPCEQALLKMQDRISYTSSGLTSVPPCRPVLISKIHPPLASNSSNSTSTGSVKLGTPSAKWDVLGNNRFRRHGGRLQQPTSWTAYLKPESPLTPNIKSAWTSDLPENSKLVGSKIP